MRSVLSLFLFLTALLPVAMAAPVAPSGLNGYVTGGSTATLSWVDNSNNETDFLIGYRLSTFENYSLLTSVAANATTVNLTGLTPGAFHQFVVVARDAANAQSPFSNAISLTTPAVYRSGYLNQAFSFPLFSADFQPVTQYAISELPPGLTLNATSGLISGTPTSTVRVRATVTTTLSNASTLTRPLVLHIFTTAPALQDPIVVSSPADRSVIVGTLPPMESIAGVFTDPDVSSAVRLTTNRGVLDFAFFPESAPQTVANFIGYATRGDFNSTLFHRSIPNFIIQAGAFRANATASAVPTQAPVVNEPRITNTRGTIAMAKIGGNPNSATNQFFINLADNASNLDNQNEGFTVFGRVAGNGMAVADAIAGLTRANYASVNGALTDAPVTVTPAPAVYDPFNLVSITTANVVPPMGFSMISSDPGKVAVSLINTDFSLTPLALGTATITLTATDLDARTISTSFQVTVQDGYQSWASQQNFALPADAAPDADPDKDGRVNLLEFTLASPPLTSSADSAIPATDNGHLTLTFPLSNSPLTGTSLQLQSAESPDGVWTTRWTNTDGLTHPWIASSQASAGFTTITARDPDAFTANPRRFLRLRAVQP